MMDSTARQEAISKLMVACKSARKAVDGILAANNGAVDSEVLTEALEKWRTVGSELQQAVALGAAVLAEDKSDKPFKAR